MATRRDFLKLLPAFAAGLYVACSGGKKGDFNDTQVLGDEATLTPVITNSEITVGPNRLAFALLDGNGKSVVDAKMHLIFYDLSSGTAEKKFEVDGIARTPARDAGIEEQVVHIHADGTRHIHVNAGADVGVYTANVSFDHAGDWGVEMVVDSTKPKLQTTLRPRFNVIAKSLTPLVGTAAPRSKNLTAADVTDLASIDSAVDPEPAFHTQTIADALAKGRPAMILFAAPGYCTSRLCGPEYEIMRKLWEQYKARAEFIHVEVYKDPGSPARALADAAKDWGLQTEPWFFVVDSKGIIAAKFEGPVSLQELEDALKPVLV
ncbi:MAG TPA: hypothetical protein VI759_03770 [Dehalococcoidia bacterium]|nr:hypothetical protein [Dehalococcoidia bacterium]